MFYYLFLFLLRLTRPFLISKRPSKNRKKRKRFIL